MTHKIRIGISACLLGKKVRYDAGDSLDNLLKVTFGRYVQWISVCPEVECGLTVPREPMILIGAPGNPRLVTRYSGIDHTEMFNSWVVKKLKELEGLGISGFVLKSRSPSCGHCDTKVYLDSGEIIKGSGLFASALCKRFPLLPVQTNSGLYKSSKMVNFFSSVIVYNRYRRIIYPEQNGLK